jgi:protein kinase-like protein
MRLAAKKPLRRGLGEGTVVGGYVVDAAPDVQTRAEVLYAVTAPGGEPATLVAPSHPYADRRTLGRIRRLAALRLELTHPALIPVRAFGERGGEPYLITDAQPSRTFGDVVAERAPLEPDALLAMLQPIGEALDLAHRRGLVHEHLSSESLLLAGDQLLVDSFALLGSGSDRAWRTLLSGDLRYTPPEQLRDESLSPAANVYSLTALIVHGLTGAPPYQGARPAVAYGHITEPPPRVSERVPELGPAIDEVISWGMAKDPFQRPRSAPALLQAVEDALGGVQPAHAPGPPSVAVSDAPKAPPGPPTIRRRRRSAMLAAAVAGAAVFGALVAVATEPLSAGDSSQPPRNGAAGALKRLDARRVDLRGQLASAETPQDQVAAARELATAYGLAARSAPRVAGAAGTAAEAYSDLAAAGEAGDPSRYAEAADVVAGAERGLSVAARQR